MTALSRAVLGRWTTAIAAGSVAAAVAVVASCSGRDTNARRDTALGATEAAIPVRIAPVTERPEAEPIVATGVIALRDEIALSFKIGGVVTQVAVREGQAVRAGDLLATLDLREIDAQVAKARAALTKAERDLARVTRLHADSVATRQQLDDATTGAEVARADLETAAVNRQYARIVAPSAGVILRRTVEPGELVSPGTPALTLGSRSSGTVVRAALPDRDVLRVKLGDPASVRLDAGTGGHVRGVVRQIAATADQRTGTYLVEIAVDGSASLLPGMIARVEIEASDPEPLRAVPVEALLEANGDRATVFALGADGRAKRVDVRVAFVRGEFAGVRGGLGGITRVVTDGAAYLDDGARVRVMP